MAKEKMRMLTIMLILLCCLLASLFNVSVQTVYAEDKVYSNVLYDLQKDENFNDEKYPEIANKYSLEVIQIAESVDKELFVYVYQPCLNEDLTATTINISVNEGLYFVNYSLTLLNKDKTLCKYIVNGFKATNEEERKYEISSIFRKWKKEYDEEIENNNTSSEKSFEVAQQWLVTEVDGKLKYDCLKIDVIEIKKKYVGFVRYEGGYAWDGITYNSCDNHFVAFSTEQNIERLLEADVYYNTRSYRYEEVESMTALTKPTIKYGDVVTEKPAQLKYTDKEYYQGSWFRQKYTWDKISTVEQFIEQEKDREHVYHVALVGDVRKESKLSDEGLDEIKDKQWVLRFATTNYSFKKYGFQGITDITTEINSTQVMDVSILRLKFENDGQPFNVGVVDNKQTGDGNPDNDTTTTFEPAKWIVDFIEWFRRLYWMLKVLFLIAVGTVGLILIYGLCKLLSLPFKIFKDGK